MCGIAGFARPGGFPRAAALAAARAMAGRLSHRGPDDEGYLYDEALGVTLAHRRLSILDLTPTGRQPMESADGRFAIAFNGEIYNHLALRAELDREGRVAWRGRSDTETLLECFSRRGVVPTLRRAAGMFAFALIDRRERALILARDRFGEKPLYHGRSRDAFLFASELSALAAHPAFRPALDRDALALYLRHGFVPGPRSIYTGIGKLPPGTLLTLPLDRAVAEPPAPEAWWSLAAAGAAGFAEPFTGSDEEAADELERLLARAIAGQRVADVPLGAFLSGGVDSATVVALMRAGSPARVRTFTVGFGEPEFDESAAAAAVAAHLGADHTALTVTPRDALDALPGLPALFDEPFGDASALPTALVARLARGSVTVALTGDGGDELFGGYLRYARASALRDARARLPRPLRPPLAALLSALARLPIDRLPVAFGPPGERQSPSEKAAALAALLSAGSDDDFYRAKFSIWKRPEALVAGGADPGDEPLDLPPALPFAERMALADLARYLPDDILVKVDRAGMAASLESRVPLLDPDVAAFALRLPARLKCRDGVTKWLLRKVLHRYVPPALTDRPKRGFAAPVGEWLRGPLRTWADDLLAPSTLRRQGFLRPGPLLRRWREHRAGRYDWQHHLWPVLMFQGWLAARGE